tara:strand:- start:18 stop:269 length:252 start_codon:yes stop_codon:yes gene_type:complete
MLQVVSTCETSAYQQSGAFIVALVFLSVFVILIFGDAVLTALALRGAMTKDERLQELDAKYKVRKSYLKELNFEIANIERRRF